MPGFQPDIPALFLPKRYGRDEIVTLDSDEERHARALRLRAGDPLLLLDGNGSRTDAVVERIDRRSVAVRIGESVLDGAEGRTYIVLGIGILSDRARFEWLVEKAVELGVREIQPLVTARSEGRIQTERTRRIAIAALKQSQRSFLPAILEPLPFAQMVGSLSRFGHSYICHETASPSDSLVRFLCDSAVPPSLAILIGPEGGFSSEEACNAQQAGAIVASLGEARLRAETAALVALSLAASLSDARPRNAG
ncbi:MAG: 16S rRNA (uracil(1498)-N(3))-methyltransferase [Bacteroidetes bacterium]|nr:16S rRNA (uracil(1498)-N(3))-methyltransferase [Bacteroidota bacterium]